MAGLDQSTQERASAESKKDGGETDSPQSAENTAQAKILPPRPQTAPATQPAAAAPSATSPTTSPASQPSPTSQPATQPTTQPAPAEPTATELGERLNREGLTAANRENLRLQKEYIEKCQERVEELNRGSETLAGKYAHAQKLQADSAKIDLNKSAGYLELSREASNLAEASAELISANEKTIKALDRLRSFSEISVLDKKKVEAFRSELESHNKLLARIKTLHSKVENPSEPEPKAAPEQKPKPRPRTGIGTFGGGR